LLGKKKHKFARPTIDPSVESFKADGQGALIAPGGRDGLGGSSPSDRLADALTLADRSKRPVAQSLAVAVIASALLWGLIAAIVHFWV
jgi:hypothetical protein